MIVVSFLLALACGAASNVAPTATPDMAPPAAPSAPAATAAVPSVAADIDVAELKNRVDAGNTFVLDVRTPGEFSQEHVPGAVNIPLQELGARTNEIPVAKDQVFEVICASGARSAAATRMLHEAGWAQATNVEGGTAAWVRAGYPTQ